nr:hypothetical protein GCM10020063_088510 [Dactylosporangium thailandense]
MTEVGPAGEASAHGDTGGRSEDPCAGGTICVGSTGEASAHEGVGCEFSAGPAGAAGVQAGDSVAQAGGSEDAWAGGKICVGPAGAAHEGGPEAGGADEGGAGGTICVAAAAPRSAHEGGSAAGPAHEGVAAGDGGPEAGGADEGGAEDGVGGTICVAAAAPRSAHDGGSAAGPAHKGGAAGGTICVGSSGARCAPRRRGGSPIGSGQPSSSTGCASESGRVDAVGSSLQRPRCAGSCPGSIRHIPTRPYVHARSTDHSGTPRHFRGAADYQATRCTSGGYPRCLLSPSR